MLRGSVHLCVGEEAVPPPSANCLIPTITSQSTHRGHGHCLAKGADPGKALAELMGKEDGYAEAAVAPCTLPTSTRATSAQTPLSAAVFPIAVGAALASKMQNNGKVAISFFGDGATNEGIFSRIAEPCRRLEAARCVRLRKQRIRYQRSSMAEHGR